jgi:hypothetical protein
VSANPESSLSYRGKAVVRAIGAILISACAAMVVLGVTVLSDRLQGPRYVLYWSWCFLVTALSLLVALYDMIMIRRASRQTRRDLFRQQFKPDRPSEDSRPD